MTLFPVILPVPEGTDRLSGKERVALQSTVARKALRLSAEKSGLELGELRKGKDDVPQPCGNHYWSISHKPRYVAAVVSDGRIGIDIEEMRPRTGSIFDYVASTEEWELSKRKDWHTFFRYWTAKEAVLKAVGTGLSGLKKCRVVNIPNEAHIVLEYQGRAYAVEQLQYRDHMVSVLKTDNRLQWVTPEAPGLSGGPIPLVV